MKMLIKLQFVVTIYVQWYREGLISVILTWLFTTRQKLGACQDIFDVRLTCTRDDDVIQVCYSTYETNQKKNYIT